MAMKTKPPKAYGTHQKHSKMEFYSDKSSPQEIKESNKQHNLTTKATRKKKLVEGKKSQRSEKQ